MWSDTSAWHMSWGYWGIVTGLAIMLGVFFFSIALVYSGVGNSRQATRRQGDKPVEGAKEPYPRAA